MDYAPNTPRLDVPAMNKPILDNYNAHVQKFIKFLKKRLSLQLFYDGPFDLYQHIVNRTTYACSINSKKNLKDIFPIMIGSDLDLCIRHQGARSFQDLKTPPSAPFQNVDIGRGFFIINGFLRHVPYFFTNDPTNTHVIQKKIIRVYTYDTLDRGKKLSYYVADTETHKCGDLVVVHNDGRESDNDDHFFQHCPYPTHSAGYMAHLYRNDTFDIDHLANKMIVSPGHLFVKLFIKYLYAPLRAENWSLLKSKAALVRKSIDTGCLLHVLSRKTEYFKEGQSAGKMTNAPKESHREIGANGEVFVEKSIGCYREVNMQTYPLNPYLLYLIIRQISKKVKLSNLSAYHPSYVGFLCILGCFETKNIGRTTMMVRDTIVSTSDALDPVFHDDYSEFWKELALKHDANSTYYVVVNEACVPVTQKSFLRLDLLHLKRTFHTIECYEKGKFIFIRYKVGLIMKWLKDLCVTPYDEMYWAEQSTKDLLIQDMGYPYITSYLVDLNPFFHHNAFPKNILAFNALKNAILVTNPKYVLYFMDTISAYMTKPTKYHQTVLQPEDDGVSEHFVLRVPRVTVAYASFLGCTQEDCIVQNAKVRAFDCFRFYTLRFKVKTNGWIRFYPVRGDPDDTDFLGTLVSDQLLEVEPFSIHVRIHSKGNLCHLHFVKPPFRVVQHVVTGDKLTVCVEQEHVSSTGDKLCTFHGQKGVIRIMDQTLTLDETVEPDLIVNPYSLFRMTVGQILEGVKSGGKDAQMVRNSEGELIPDMKAFYGPTFYFPIAYWSSEHLYAPQKCIYDKVLGQAVKGRSRGGGMRLGNMELFNALRGNGLACCFEEKFFEDGDRTTESIPKSVNLVQEDARFFKCHLEYQTEPTVVEIPEKKF